MTISSSRTSILGWGVSRHLLRAAAFLLCLACAPATVFARSHKPPQAPPRLPEHILVGYWQNFTSSAAANQTLAQVPAAYTIIEVSFADPDRPIDGGVTFALNPQLSRAIPGGYSTTQFIADIQTLHQQGRFVLLSVGGEHRSFALTSNEMVANFVSSTYALIRQYGFDGIDIDLENVITADNYTFLEEALRQLSARAGPNLMITMAPQTNDMLPANPALDNYLKIAIDLGNIITMVNTQYYNSGTKRGRDGKVYAEGTIDFITSQADAVLQYLDPSKFGIGLPASPAGRGYMPPAMINAAFDCLTSGIHCGSYLPVAKYPTLRGVMDWSTNWDAANGNQLSSAVSAHMSELPR